MSTNPLNDISKIYLENVAESAVPGKPAERLGAVTGISKADQMSAAERIKKKTAEKKAALEKKHGKKMDDHPEYPKKKYVDEKLDPVGQEDADIDNDGDTDKSDKYLHKRRKAIGKAMKKRLKEERESLSEVIDDKAPKTVKEKKVNNKVIINPKLGEAVEEMGGTLIEHIEVDEMDFIVESVYDELIEEGYSEDDVEAAIENAMEATVTFGHDTKDLKKDGSQVGSRRKFLKRKAGEFLQKAKKKAGMASAQAQVAAYNKGREVKQAVADKTRAKKQGLKRFVKKAAQKVVDRMSEENVEEAYTVTAADKKGNTKAYQNYKAGMKGKDGKPLYKAADHMGEQKVSESNMSPERLKKINDRISKMGILYPTGKKKKTSVALRKEKEASMKEEASMSQQELMLQKKKARIDKMIAMRRSQELNKTKSGDQPAKAMGEGLSVDQQMKISQEYNRMSPEEKKAANKKAMGNVKKVAPEKDARTDAQKMTDATGPRPGSRYRGD